MSITCHSLCSETYHETEKTNNLAICAKSNRAIEFQLDKLPCKSVWAWLFDGWGGESVLIFRSLLFNVVFYLNLIVQMLVQTPIYFLLPRRLSLKIVKNWCRSSNWWYKIITHTKMEVSGLENLPEDGCILAIKHQSIWEFFCHPSADQRSCLCA